MFNTETRWCSIQRQGGVQYRDRIVFNIETGWCSIHRERMVFSRERGGGQQRKRMLFKREQMVFKRERGRMVINRERRLPFFGATTFKIRTRMIKFYRINILHSCLSASKCQSFSSFVWHHYNIFLEKWLNRQKYLEYKLDNQVRSPGLTQFREITNFWKLCSDLTCVPIHM